MGDTKLLAKLSEGNMIAREVCYCEQCMKKFRNKFSKFPNNKKKNNLKDVQKNLRATAVAKCMSFVEDSLESSDEVESFIKL